MSQNVVIVSQFTGVAYKFAAEKSLDEEGDCILVTLMVDGKVGHYRALVATSPGRDTSILTNMKEYQGWQVFQCHADADQFTSRLKICDKASHGVRSPNTTVLSLLKVSIP